MGSPTFQRDADACLKKIERWLEGFDPDELDYSTRDGVVELEFADGARFVVSRQSAADQIWLAAGARGWHYGLDAASGAWKDDRDGHDLYANLASVVSAKLGRVVAL